MGSLCNEDTECHLKVGEKVGAVYQVELGILHCKLRRLEQLM